MGVFTVIYNGGIYISEKDCQRVFEIDKNLQNIKILTKCAFFQSLINIFSVRALPT